jgi:hypothetical protein
MMIALSFLFDAEVHFELLERQGRVHVSASGACRVIESLRKIPAMRIPALRSLTAYDFPDVG